MPRLGRQSPVTKRFIVSKDFTENLRFILLALSPLRRKQLFGVSVLMVIAAALEIFSLGAVIPFLAVLVQPDIVFENPIIKDLFVQFGFVDSSQILLPVTIFFVAATISSSLIRLFLSWSLIRVSHTAGRDISILAFDRVLNQSYLGMTSKNSSEIVSALSNKTTLVVIQGLIPALVMLSGFVTLLSVVTAFTIWDPVVSFSIFSILSVFYLVVILATKKKLITNSNAMARHTSSIVKIVNEALGDSRELIITNHFSPLLNKYSDVEKALRLSQGNSKFVSESPRFIIEALGIVLIALLAYILSSKETGLSIIPILGALALAAQRLLPIVQAVFNGWAQIKQGSESLSDVVELLQLTPNADAKKYCAESTLMLTETLTLSGLSFSYPGTDTFVLKDVNLSIEKGSKVGILGDTGSGKSTLVDILMGLIAPTSGSLLVDGVALDDSNRAYWRQSIAHVPQSIFLADESILSFITGAAQAELVDYVQLADAVEISQLTSVIDRFKLGYQTVVGERGVNLSGGQLQRLAIARALYKTTKILILDEATSALDVNTEKLLMESLLAKRRDLTIIMIAHRIETLKDCDQLLEVSPMGVSIR
jgi:ABC-type multidrug transport system fused ATPase/permease subunit